jgi:hypothetical protein
MKKITLLFLLLFCSIGFTQNDSFKKPNYSEIEKKIKLKDSKFYYPKLIKKYYQSDPSLSLEEKRVLYYGFIYSPKYSPYGSREFTDKITAIFKNNYISEEDYEKIIEYSDILLEKNPFNINAINYKLYACKQIQNSSDVIKASVKLQIINDAILSSGEGLTKETAYVVINPNHEYSFLNLLGFTFSGLRSTVEQYDYLSLKENEQNIEGLYFDASASANYMSNLFKNKD